MLKLSPILASALLFAPAANASEISVKHNPLDDSTRYMLVMTSTNTVPNSIGVEKHVGLGVRCVTGGEKAFLFMTPTYNGTNFDTYQSTVRVRWNNGQVVNEVWSEADSGTGFFSRKPMTDLAKAAKSDRLVVGWYPYQSTEKFATFNLKGYRSDLTKMIQLCK